MWVAMSRSPRPNHCGSISYAASSDFTTNVSSARPQPWSSEMPPPSVYITVSRSGQTRRPNSQMSSAVLPMTVTSASSAAEAAYDNNPRRKRAAPMPPAGTTIRMPQILANARRSLDAREAPECNSNRVIPPMTRWVEIGERGSS